MGDDELNHITKDQVNLVADGIRGALQHYYRENAPHILVHPLADYLILLYERPCYVSFYMHDQNGTPKGPSWRHLLSLQDRRFLGIPHHPKTLEALSENPHVRFWHHPARFGNVTVLVRSLFPDHPLPMCTDGTKPLDRLHAVLEEELSGPLCKAALEYSALQDDGDHSTEETQPWQLDTVDDDAVREHAFAPLRQHLGRLFKELHGVTAVLSNEKDEGAINLFAVVRWALPSGQRTVKPPRGFHICAYPYCDILLNKKWVKGSRCRRSLTRLTNVLGA